MSDISPILVLLN